MSPDDRHHDEAIRAMRDAEGLDAIKSNHAAFFALLAAAPDAQSAAESIAARFNVSVETAENALRQRIVGILPRR